MRLIGYVRVSKVGGREGDSFISPKVQRDQIEAYARVRGHAIVRWIEDLDQPGTRWERPGFQEALDAVRDGEAGGIACAKLDRFARSVLDGRRALTQLQDVGGALVLVDFNLDTTDPFGKAMFTILLAFAELEVDRIGAAWDDARSRARERGIHPGRCAPGYRRDEFKQLVPDPDVAPAVLDAFRLRAAGGSLKAACELLDARVPKPTGSWAVATVAGMFGRRTYLGEGEAGTRHEAIVPRAVWEAAQAAGGTAPTRASAPRLLTGLVFCGTCGGAMTGTVDSRGYQHYRCRGRRAAGVCADLARVSVKRADGYVEARWLDWLRAQEALAVEGGSDTVDLAALTNAVELAESELEVYRDNAAISVIGVASYNAGLASRQQAVDEVRAALAANAGPRREQPGHLEALAVAEGGSFDERRRLLAAAVGRIVVSPGRGDGRIAISWLRDGTPDAAVAAAGDVGERDQHEVAAA